MVPAEGHTDVSGKGQGEIPILPVQASSPTTLPQMLHLSNELDGLEDGL